MLALMQRFHSQGMSLRAIARELNRLNLKTYRGCQWYDVTVKQALSHEKGTADAA